MARPFMLPCFHMRYGTTRNVAVAQVIFATDSPKLGFNVKGGNMAQGGELVLWQLEEGTTEL